jgi:hypothetical protein
VFPVPGTLALFYTFGLLGWATRRLRPSPDLDRWLTQSSLLWLLALAEVVFQRKFWGYQYHVTLLPLSALAAAGFERSRLLLRARFSARGALLCSSALALVLTLGYVQRCQRYFVQHPVLGAWLGSSTRADLERTYRWGRNVYDYESDQLVSAHIARITRPSDRIFVWSFEPILYFLAQRAPASRFLYDYPLHVPGSALNERYQEQLLSDLTAHPPAIFVVRRDDRNELEALDSMSQLAAMPGLAAYLAASYTPAWTLGDFVGYMRQSR